MLAAIRDSSVNFPLFLHVLGALALVGTLVAAAALQYVGLNRTEAEPRTAFARLAFRTLLFGAFPAWWVMRIGAQWIYSKEGWDDLPEGSEPGWLGIGYITADAGGLVILISIILAGLYLRRLRRDPGAGSGLGRAAVALTTLALLAYIVAVWAMSAKPD